MTPLDDPGLYRRLDSTDLGDRVAGLPGQCAEAWEAGLAVHLPRGYASSVERVIVGGMGGSAIGGDLIADMAALEDAPPITTIRDFHLPRWAGQDTLLLLSSYSGNTEETLSLLEDGLKSGCRIVAITSGGKLGEVAARLRLPAVTVAYTGEPRCALGYSFLAPLGVLSRVGALSQPVQWVGDALSDMERQAARLGPATPSADNRAKRLASALHGKLLVVWTAGLLRGAGRRWKTQANENAKSWGMVEELPEAHHNAVVGLGLPRPLHDLAMVVLLHPANLEGAMAQRYELSKRLLEREGVAHEEVRTEGNPLAQVLTVVHLGDYTSYYLAMLNGVDPHPVPSIDFLKAHDAQRQA